MTTQKTPLSGRPITRKEAFKGLGDPKTWKKFSDSVYAEFRAKPRISGKPNAAESKIETLKGVFRRIASKQQEPVYAGRPGRKRVKSRKKRRKNN